MCRDQGAAANDPNQTKKEEVIDLDDILNPHADSQCSAGGKKLATLDVAQVYKEQGSL